ncbi:MAG: hypothetical protein KBC78_00795 [Candidatus Pacebacteria bacterium]|nr:hypothetical protein [Candidatus Paceibacterota bacterium]
MDTNSNEQNNQTSPTSTEITNPAQPTQSENKEKESDYTFNETTIMASLSYVGPLVLIPFLTKKEDPFIMFHVKQGLVLFGLEIVIMFITMMSFGLLAPITGLINIGLLVLSIIGILNALKMKEVKVPVTGAWAEKIKI